MMSAIPDFMECSSPEMSANQLVSVPAQDWESDRLWRPRSSSSMRFTRSASSVLVVKRAGDPMESYATIVLTGANTALDNHWESEPSSIAEEIRSVAKASARPETDAVDDPLLLVIQLTTDEYGPAAVQAIRLMFRDAGADPTLRERLVRALGAITNVAALSAATDFLIEALADPSAHVRDAAISIMALGSDPLRAASALRKSGSHEAIAVLRSAMLQTAEQLEEWGRRRATSCEK